MSTYVFILYVAGRTARAENVIAGLRRALDDERRCDYELIVHDVLEQPQIAEEAKILATPTLVKERPLPIRRIIGDLSDTTKVLSALGLHAPSQGER